MNFSLVMTVNIDCGIYACSRCGSLVHGDLLDAHTAHHADLDRVVLHQMAVK